LPRLLCRRNADGSERAGSAVAALAGKYLKKSVLELGGSDPFLVLEDADIEKAVEVGLFSRLANAGQSCIGAKRWLLAETIADDFLHLLTQKIQAYKLADPLLPDTKMAVMARPDLADTLARQVELSCKMGAQLLVGGERENNYFAPTILTEVTTGMPAFDQELFGPVIAVKTFKTEVEGLQLANMTGLGLGASIWTQDREKAMRYAREMQAGTVALNALVRSDAKMPFGGTKKSGYGANFLSWECENLRISKLFTGISAFFLVLYAS
jgi:succinate-semialdehyde dehydrogenase/glutarate-semialdehyde dehydrogenase